MKKQLIYLTAACAIAGFAVSCNSDDPTDASEKHVYTEGDYAPYLRTNTAATVALSLNFPLANIDESIEIDLKDYASYFHENMSMTVDEVLAAYDNGEVVFYNIAVTKGRWDQTAPTCGTSGWYYTSAGVVTDDASAAKAKVVLDRSNHKIICSMINEPDAGTVIAINVGFAIDNGSDYDDYVRFNPTLTVTDPGKVITSINLDSTVDYDSDVISFDDFAEDIEFSTGFDIDDFCEGVDDSEAWSLYMEDQSNNNEWLRGYSSTAGSSLSYWLDTDLKPCSWTGSYPTNYLFIETWGTDDRGVYVGLAPGIPAGTSQLVRFVYVYNADESRNVEFIVTVNAE